MASAATWALSASPRQLPAAPHCVVLPPLPPPPQCRLQRPGPSRRRAAHSFVAMASEESFTTTTTTTARTATGETVTRTIVETSEEGTTELPEIVKALQQKWDKVEDKYAVATIAFAGVIALWASAGVISAIDRLPLVPGVLELVGISYTGWFVYQNLVFKPDREAWIEKIKSTYNDIIGSS